MYLTPTNIPNRWFESVEKFYVVTNEEGKFFKLNRSFGTTHPEWLDSPLYAERVVPAHFSEVMKEPTYYFENSSRMKDWLKGTKLVLVSLKSIVTPVGKE